MPRGDPRGDGPEAAGPGRGAGGPLRSPRRHAPGSAAWTAGPSPSSSTSTGPRTSSPSGRRSTAPRALAFIAPVFWLALPGDPQRLVRARLRLRRRLRPDPRGLGGRRQRAGCRCCTMRRRWSSARRCSGGGLQGRAGAADDAHHRRLGPALSRGSSDVEHVYFYEVAIADQPRLRGYLERSYRAGRGTSRRAPREAARSPPRRPTPSTGTARFAARGWSTCSNAGRGRRAGCCRRAKRAVAVVRGHHDALAARARPPPRAAAGPAGRSARTTRRSRSRSRNQPAISACSMRNASAAGESFTAPAARTPAQARPPGCARLPRRPSPASPRRESRRCCPGG